MNIRGTLVAHKFLSWLLVVSLVVLLSAIPASATVLFSRIANDICTVDVGVSSSVMDYTQSDDTPNSRFFCRDDTPVPSTGRSLYLRNDFQNLQHDSGNAMYVTQIDLTVGQTYYMGGFFRFDRISSNDVWHDTSGPDSYDKLLEFAGGNIRWIILAGWPNGNYLGSYNGNFTFDLYASPQGCTGCDNPSEKWANVSPYGQNNPYLCDYGRWYAVVMKITISSANTSNGLVELFINGTKTTSLTSQKTQDSGSPYIPQFGYSGTVAQPAYDAPAHYRKIDSLTFANSLTDMENAGLMSDPEEAGGGSSTGGSMDVKHVPQRNELARTASAQY